ncbi:PAS domain-containing protein [Sodalis sp. RH21]|uniref:PAS domain-containing protein n=1 Tax=unclassified Sodalis (in: enterobacteria) TaxID=2636512 RepID=UPI0039B4AFD1
MEREHSCNTQIIPEINISKDFINTFDELPDPYCIKNLESRIIYANPAMAKEVFNVKSTAELIGKLDCEINSKLEDFDNPREFVRQDQTVIKKIAV